MVRCDKEVGEYWEAPRCSFAATFWPKLSNLSSSASAVSLLGLTLGAMSWNVGRNMCSGHSLVPPPPPPPTHPSLPATISPPPTCLSLSLPPTPLAPDPSAPCRQPHPSPSCQSLVSAASCRRCMASWRSLMAWQGCCACAKGPHGFRTSF